jgi:hypothetical protein
MSLQFFGGGELEVFEWDTLYMAGKRWPGICTISGKGIARRLDQKRTKGSDGATLKDEGNDLAEFTIELLIYNRTDWAELQELIPLVSPRRSGGPRQPLAISYPSLALLGISACYIKAISVPSIDKNSQQLTVTMSAIEWVAKPKKVKKAAGTRRGKSVADPNSGSVFVQDITQADPSASDGRSLEEDRAIQDAEEEAARNAQRIAEEEEEEFRRQQDPSTVVYGPVISGEAEDNTF